MTEPSGLFSSGGGGGNFPKLADLEGKLVLLKPTVIEKAPAYKKPGEFVDRATVDCTVFEADGTWETHEDMYFSQTAIVGACKRALKPGAKPFILGRVQMLPTKDMKNQGIDTAEKLQKAREDWLKKGAKGDEPAYFWGFDDFTPADVELAMKFLSENGPLASVGG